MLSLLCSFSRGEGQLHDLLAQLLITDTHSGCLLRQKRGRRHTGQGVDLKKIGNAIIAQNNATIAAQNAQIAAGQQQAQAAYTLANQLGLIQSYAAAGSTYYYQDGVFYSMDANGQYSVIVPPAGALVETLPEDYDLVTLADGNEYYKVDDTVYKVTIVEGKPYFEVLGQLYQ